MSIKVLIVDNYDSFTYNLAHYLEALGADITVLYNDQIDLGSLSQYDKIVLSPGPGLPKESNQLMGVIKEVYKQKPAKGLCYALNIPLISISTLEAMAHSMRRKYESKLLCPMIDARRMEVYCALFGTINCHRCVCFF